MPFLPSPHDELTIKGINFYMAEHPNAPGIPYGQEGRQAVVYQLYAEDDLRALKVFKPRFSVPALVSLADKMAPLAAIPGLQVCQRIVLTPRRHRKLLRQHPELTYAVLMPWVEGPTWYELLLEKRAITSLQSLTIARVFTQMLVLMEEQGVAHCDLSGANLILSPDLDQPTVALVDVEGLYGPGIPQPKILPAGSPGYAHEVASHGLWSPEADRFSGAIMLAEILGWCSSVVRDVAWGENYFLANEVQKDCERYRTLISSVGLQWGDDLAKLLALAWHSDTLAECPTFGQWMVALPDDVPTIVTEDTIKSIFSQELRIESEEDLIVEEVDSTKSNRDRISFEAKEQIHEPSLVSEDGKIFVLGKKTMEIGRPSKYGSPDIDLSELDISFVSSRNHAVIIPAEGNYILKPNNTMNGTFVNSREISSGEDHVLQTGDILEFGYGGVKMTYRLPKGK